LILSQTLEIALLVSELSPASLLFEQSPLLQRITLLTVYFRSILRGSSFLIFAPVALIVRAV
jgi:hypothetical protein